MSVLYIKIFLCANIEIGCVYQNFNEHAAKIKKVLSAVSSLLICRYEIYVCMRKQMVALIVRRRHY